MAREIVMIMGIIGNGGFRYTNEGFQLKRGCILTVFYLMKVDLGDGEVGMTEDGVR